MYRCVNRLDRDTSGLLILAKNMFSAAVLYRQSAERKIHREYLAIAAGEIPEEGIIDAPIARAADSVIMRCVDFSCGERAVTHYRRLLYSKENDCSLLRIRLETGRTHQIRVHMKYIGHPLLGDFLYHPTAIEQMKTAGAPFMVPCFYTPGDRETNAFYCTAAVRYAGNFKRYGTAIPISGILIRNPAAGMTNVRIFSGVVRIKGRQQTRKVCRYYGKNRKVSRLITSNCFRVFTYPERITSAQKLLQLLIFV